MARTKEGRNIAAMKAELEEIKADLADFGPDGFYAVPYATIKRDFPVFSKAIIESFLSSMGYIKKSDLKGAIPPEIEEQWKEKQLVEESDWPMLISAAEKYYCNNTELADWGKILVDYNGTEEDITEGYENQIIDDDYVDNRDLQDDPKIDEHVICSWCGEEYPISDCEVDTKLG